MNYFIVKSAFSTLIEIVRPFLDESALSCGEPVSTCRPQT